MKRIAMVLVSLASLVQTQAQLLRPEPLEGALWGGLIGGLVGGGRHHGFSGEGAAIGAGVGLLAGALASESRRNYYYDSPSYGYTTYPSVSLGYGYGGYGSSAYVYYAPNNYCAPGYYYRPTRPNYVVSGTVLGAASGALIGSANHHNAGKGALIGAGTGLLLGSVAEHAANREEQRVVAAQNAAPATVVTAPAMQDVRPQTSDSAAARGAITSTPAPTSTYYWTPRPQIPDAPRVPDAPTF